MTKFGFRISVDADEIQRDVSSTLFGIFLEDINFAVDGGLNANMVNNHSFDGVYMNTERVSNVTLALRLKKTITTRADRLRFWSCNGGKIESLQEEPVSENSWYARIHSQGKCRLENRGYNGGKSKAGACAMSIAEGKEYEFSCWIRSYGFKGSIKVFAEDESGHMLTGYGVLEVGNKWSLIRILLEGKKTSCGKLVLLFEGDGAVDIDCVSFMDRDTWGKDDPRWSQGKLRKDMVEALRDLKPKFMRFPGGCIVEGIEKDNEYRWKDSVGPIIDRRPNYNLWGAAVPEGGYVQSLQVGFYEYFLICEDLHMEPLPVVWAGMNCQLRRRGRLPADSAEFREKVVQNALDLIEYANGDPDVNPWAKLRADAGHPERFNLKYIGIGNENWGEDYLDRFETVKRAIDEKYPGIICIMSTGALYRGRGFWLSWRRAREKFPDVYVDEHFYMNPGWIARNHNRYDNYSRGTAKVFLGEYAARLPISSMIPNSYKSALAEAAFLTGIERNSDVVAMTSYAPLFSLVDGSQWRHNLINFSPAHVLKTANYFVQQLFGTTVGEKVVRIRTDLPKGVYASASASSEKLILKLINTKKYPVTVRLEVLNVSSGSANILYLQSDDLSTANSLGFTGEPVYNIRPEAKEVALNGGMADIEMDKYSFYVIMIDK